MLNRSGRASRDDQCLFKIDWFENRDNANRASKEDLFYPLFAPQRFHTTNTQSGHWPRSVEFHQDVDGRDGARP